MKGKTVAVDATTLEANAAMKSIVRRDTGEDWQEYVKRLMLESSEIEEGDEPSAEEIARFDRKRKDKKVSNEEWQSETGPASRAVLSEPSSASRAVLGPGKRPPVDTTQQHRETVKPQFKP